MPLRGDLTAIAPTLWGASHFAAMVNFGSLALPSRGLPLKSFCFLSRQRAGNPKQH